MNNWDPYKPDYNPPPGIPKGYPYALNPTAPSMNPMHPNMNTSYPSANPTIGINPMATGPSPYPAPGISQPTPGLYPTKQTPYPSTGSSAYPSTGYSPYSSTGTSPFPSTGSSPSYPTGPTPYPSAGPSPYPSTESSPYPSTGSSPFSSTGTSPYTSAGTSPYPSAGTSPYPSSGASPYPSTGASPYPSSGASPYSSTGASPYPSTGTSPYPSTGTYLHSGASPYPSAGLSPYPATGPTYPNQTNFKPGYPSNQHRTMADYITGEGTVKPYPDFDPKVDAEVLRKAMKGFGTDEKAIIKVLANRSNSQRVYIAIAFKQLFGKDLIDDLKSELSGNFESVILGLMMPLNDYLATELHKAIAGIGTKEGVLIEILCTRTNQEIWGINEAYSRLYGTPLEEDIKGDTSGHFERMLISACNGARSEAPADGMRAKETAEALYQAGAGQWGTDESVFNAILLSESFNQLAHTFYEYQKLTGTTVTQAIESEMSGDVKDGMLAVAKCVENRPFYFAEKLYKAMKGLGTDDDTLIRIVVSRCEIDMVQIKAEYERNYGKPLSDAIKGDTSGDYKRVLVALVDGI